MCVSKGLSPSLECLNLFTALPNSLCRVNAACSCGATGGDQSLRASDGVWRESAAVGAGLVIVPVSYSCRRATSTSCNVYGIAGYHSSRARSQPSLSNCTLALLLLVQIHWLLGVLCSDVLPVELHVCQPQKHLRDLWYGDANLQLVYWLKRRKDVQVTSAVHNAPGKPGDDTCMSTCITAMISRQGLAAASLTS